MTATIPAARSAEWHAERRTGIGSSDAPIITGDAPWGDVLTLYAVKAGIIDEPGTENAYTRWGLKLEDVVAEWATEETGRKVRRVNRRLHHSEHPWMQAALDRVYVGEKRLLEIKTRRYPTDEWGEGGTAEIPPHYLVQVQHQLAVTGFAVADLAVLFSGSDPRLYTIPRDDGLISALIELESEFWACVVNGSPPDPLSRRQRAVIPMREGEIEAVGPLADGIELVYRSRAEIKELKSDLEKAEDAVKTLMGDFTAARAGAYRATYKPAADARVVAWELIAQAYRKLLPPEQAEQAATIEGLFTSTRAGARPLRVSIKEEAYAAAG